MAAPGAGLSASSGEGVAPGLVAGRWAAVATPSAPELDLVDVPADPNAGDRVIDLCSSQLGFATTRYPLTYRGSHGRGGASAAAPASSARTSNPSVMQPAPPSRAPVLTEAEDEEDGGNLLATSSIPAKSVLRRRPRANRQTDADVTWPSSAPLTGRFAQDQGQGQAADDGEELLASHSVHMPSGTRHLKRQRSLADKGGIGKMKASSAFLPTEGGMLPWPPTAMHMSLMPPPLAPSK
ncbi:hypothetical protein V8C86DRAFT_2624382, partial [Haematococcus lacustris]